jgi:hypothetical protein
LIESRYQVDEIPVSETDEKRKCVAINRLEKRFQVLHYRFIAEPSKSVVAENR